jgi:hypothetical protein
MKKSKIPEKSENSGKNPKNQKKGNNEKHFSRHLLKGINFSE